MERKTKIVIGIVFVIALLLAWAPWISNEYAISKVTEKIGGSDATFFYLDKNIPVKDIPKEVIWFPFVRYVVFPSEAGWFVTFYGSVI